METQEFTDYQRKQIADKGYASDIWKKGNLVKIDNRKTYVGTVAKVVRGRDDVKGDDPNGLDAVAIKDEKTKTIRIIFQGSKGRKDWRDNDILLVLKAAAKIKGPTGQLRAAAGFTKKVFDENKGYSIEIYGHSLGSMDGQYAIASLDAEQTTRLKGVWLYEGPNMYRILNRAEKEQVNMCRNKINNYLDPRDLASFGYSTRQYAVGSVFWVDSIRTGGKNTKDRIVNQHMWGGYQFTKDGKLILTTLSIKEGEENILDMLKQDASHWIKTRKALSESQSIYVDSMQASAVVRAIDSRMDSLEFKAQALKKKVLAEMDREWDNVIKSLSETLGGYLSHDEIEQGLASAGCTKESLIGGIRAEIEKLEESMEHECQEIYNIGNQVESGITRLVDEDEDLARQFNNYNSGGIDSDILSWKANRK